MLYDFYGELLTDRQKEFFESYYHDDLSLAEIGENAGISRQGVRDVIARADALMEDLEDKTGLVRRFQRMKDRIDAIETAAGEIELLNRRKYQDPALAELTKIIAAQAAGLRE
jgi:predicted DNA-binding protein YlxM (UPF0122 family)